MNIAQMMIWNCGHASSSSPLLHPPHTHHTVQTPDPRRKGRKRKSNKSRKTTYAKEVTDGSLLPLPAPRPPPAFVYARRTQKKMVKAETTGSKASLGEIRAISPPAQTELLKSLEIPCADHIVDSRVKSRFQGDRRLGFLR